MKGENTEPNNIQTMHDGHSNHRLGDIEDGYYYASSNMDNMPLSDDINDFEEQVCLIEDMKCNLLVQLPTYDCDKTCNFIDGLKVEYEQQMKLNGMLKSSEEVCQSNCEKIKDFTKTHKTEVMQHAKEVKNVSEMLKKIVNENANLQKKHKTFQDIINNDEYQAIAKDIRDIQQVKEDIKSFLDKRGIVTPNLY
jgi:predicted nuclease with TOPRIM domain